MDLFTAEHSVDTPQSEMMRHILDMVFAPQI
jgi:hypothetical protein